MRFKQTARGNWEPIEEVEKVVELPDTDTNQEQELPDTDPDTPIDLTTLTDEQLATLAEEKGIDISKCKTREQAIAKLQKAEIV